ncbi:MAG: aminotransferase class III-fold pyridoxal phosphate-dependent enzyme [Verrucomicrobia bacterium]|nr:aminotransferase class III-fold pyridoxal phosphate-dependent enzyme [Verrucomicrobiota bacterium]MCG2679218.1 aminotransferase class III-fold pyridoxal phosphate-dependent enzyme [Kiritimatiellia bacterium]MBU4248612.1 aminotransferase class III-fold pyridoxal phosphate-dependent enzyme [Verrucomicrobiota bacterium]MBU4290073.1 aminotransferase class III-fold pyridoxal phosphate-dependent enzyme [Verrucomicrobiota bacterium]MBU4430349.1 aminotransferase class III-fold pyridoxal phosphate-de
MNQTQAWTERLRAVIPWGSSTCSKAASYMPDEPGVIVRGKGCRVWDADGREFIDYRNSLGPVTLGYCFSAVDKAIREQLKNGIIFGHPHPLEGEVAEMICDCIPCAERARFLKTGGEAIAACIRLARFHTGREHVVQIGYNGWLNSLASGGRILPGMAAAATPPGVPAALSALHHAYQWNDAEGLDTLFAKSGDTIAAVVVAADYVSMPLGKTFYPFLRELTRKYGTVLIYDEIVTGFRLAIGGVQEYFGVAPDLAVFAKGVANGMPLSVYCGRAEIMDKLKTVIVSSTYGGESLSLAAAKAAITTYRTRNVIGHIWAKAETLWRGVNALFQQHGISAELVGYWPCPLINFAPDASPDLSQQFFRAAYRHGVSLFSVPYVNFSHQDTDIAETLERLEKAIREL